MKDCNVYSLSYITPIKWLPGWNFIDRFKNSSPLTAKYKWRYFDHGSQFAVALLLYDGNKRIWGDAEPESVPITVEKFEQMALRLWRRAPARLISRLGNVTTIYIDGDDRSKITLEDTPGLSNNMRYIAYGKLDLDFLSQLGGFS